MACPACDCKVTYQFDDAEFGIGEDDMYRCAACGTIFPLEDELPEDDDISESAPNAQVTGAAPTGDSKSDER